MNNAETLPSELRMAAPPTIPQARSYMFKQKSEYTQYDIKKGTKIRINIPRLQRTYLSKDSYLRFRVNVEVKEAKKANGTSEIGAPLYFDRVGAAGLFERVEVYDYLGGTLLEQIHNLPALLTMMNDMTVPLNAYNTKLDATAGVAGTKLYNNAFKNNYVSFSTSNSGMELVSYNWNDQSNAVGKISDAFVSYEFAIPLPSFLGLFSDKFVPLHNGFSIDLFLNSTENAFVSWGAGTEAKDVPSTAAPTTIEAAWITNFEFCAQVMELGNDAENLVLSSNGSGPLVIPSRFYRYFTDLIKGAGENDQSSSFGMDLNLNVVSLRNVRFSFRPYLYQNSIKYPAYGHRIRNYLQNFNFQYGSSYLPELAGITCRSSVIPVSIHNYKYPYIYDNPPVAAASLHPLRVDDFKRIGYTQAFAELMKTGVKNHWTDASIPCSINSDEYAVDILDNKNGLYVPTSDPASTETIASFPPPIGNFSMWAGKFIGGIDLRLSAKDVISGIDTNGLLVRLNLNFDSANLTHMTNAVLDVFCEHDAFIQIVPGVATTATF